MRKATTATATATHSTIRCLPFSNDDLADVFEKVADLLEIKEDSYYRIRAYQEAAQTLRAQTRSIREISQTEGAKGLEKLPHIGQRLAASIEELLHTGQLKFLQRLLTEVSPEDLFTTIPGIGEVLAHRLYEDLGIKTLEDLEIAAHTGKLDTIEGFGKGRVRLVRNELETILNHASRHQAWQRANRSWRNSQAKTSKESLPSVELLLAIDAQYHHLAAAGQLPMIAPRRFNPQHHRWLPVMHIEKDGWWFSVLYSNTARAHELGKTHDWVVISYERDNTRGQCTVVTETRGKLRGQRVVRGRGE